MYTPKERTVTVKRREFIIGDGVNPISAKDLYDSIHIATTVLTEEKWGKDDSFFVKTDDDGRIIIYFEEEKEK